MRVWKFDKYRRYKDMGELDCFMQCTLNFILLDRLYITTVIRSKKKKDCIF